MEITMNNKILSKDKLLESSTSPDLFNLLLPDPYTIIYDIFVNDDIEALLGLIIELKYMMKKLQITIFRDENTIVKYVEIIDQFVINNKSLPYNILLHFTHNFISRYTFINIGFNTYCKYLNSFSEYQQFKLIIMNNLNRSPEQLFYGEHRDLILIRLILGNLTTEYSESNLLLTPDEITNEQSKKLYIKWIIDFANLLQINTMSVY